MADTLTPAPTTARKQRTALASRILSPTTPFFVGSNDDNLERARARAARAASMRRKSTVSFAPPPPLDPWLDKEQILELFQNCIKLASENKINQKNTWELKLIDHLSDIIKVEEDNEAKTNFQKASCTLEAGVKIYSVRVDSVHSEAYKVLGGITRASQENEKNTCVEDDKETEPNPSSKKESNRKLSPVSTLESSFEALNIKKFDAAFTVDPLYHQTTAQFDEGGAKGLLLNNLGVYEFCQVLFDSFEVPGKCSSVGVQDDATNMIDLSFISDCMEKMARISHSQNEISPTLRHIVSQFDEDNPSASSGLRLIEEREELNVDTWVFEHDDGTNFIDENLDVPDSSTYLQQNIGCDFQNRDVDERFECVDEYLLLGSGFVSLKNSWAGPDHWKYKKTKVAEFENDEEGMVGSKRPKKKKRDSETDIDFTNGWMTNTSNLLNPPKNPKSLSLPLDRLHAKAKLPEDCHYQPMNLIKLFLLPNVLCLGRRRRIMDEEHGGKYDDYGPQPSWEGEADYDSDMGISHTEDSNALISPPRQVHRVDVEYDKTSKQVDVQALKEALWECICLNQTVQEAVSFRKIVGEIPTNCVAGISPHLCFICLLHLANEHGLILRGCTSLDDLTIWFSSHPDLPS